MVEENSTPSIDWHRLSHKSTLSWEDLVGVLFGLKWSYLQNLPQTRPPYHESTAEAAKELLKWILDDCKNGKLKCTPPTSQENPSFLIHEIGLWIFKKKILFWLANDKGIPFSPKGCDFLEKVTYGHVLEPLKTNRTGGIDWEHYASATTWRFRDARQILEEANPGKLEKIEEAMQESLIGSDAILTLSVILPKAGERIPHVFPSIFCDWATGKGFQIPNAIIRVFVKERRSKHEVEKVKGFVKEVIRLQEPQETKLAQRKKEAESRNEPVGTEDFIRGLKFCYLEPHVFVNEAGKKPIPFTLESLGFHKPEGILAKEFISILKEPCGPEYDLGPSHSYSDNEISQKIEIPEYGRRKTRRDDINKKVRAFIEKEFSVILGNGCKLFEKALDKKTGVFRFKFQTRKTTPVDPELYSDMTSKEILNKLKILSEAIKNEESDVNESNTVEYLNLFNHAIKQGIPESEIEDQLNPRTSAKDPYI